MTFVFLNPNTSTFPSPCVVLQWQWHHASTWLWSNRSSGSLWSFTFIYL